MLRRDLSKALFVSAAGSIVPAEPPCAPAERMAPEWPRTAAEAKLAVTPKCSRYAPGDVRRYGAIGDWDGSTGTDSTDALRSALAVCNAAGHTMYVPAGRYRISKPLQKWQSFTCPNIRGEGYGSTRIAYPDLGSEAAIYIQGGSGRLCGAVIEGLGFDGSRCSRAIEVDGQGGLTIRDCEFGTNAAGLSLHNKTTGAFTEYVVADNCHFDGACARAVQFLVGKGNSSFHGSGLRHCAIELDESSDTPIYIGPGALPYSAPLSCQVWTRGICKTIIRNAAARPAVFHGTITVEAFGRFAARSQCPTLAGGQSVYLVGGLVNTGYVNLGTAVLGSRAALLGPESGRANGQCLIRRHPWSFRRDVAAGANSMGYLGADSGGLIYIELSGDHYDYRLVLAAAHHGHGSRGFVETLATLSDFDAAGYGPPRFSVDADGNFVVVNQKFPRCGVAAYVDVMPFGPSRTAYLDSAVEYVNP